MKWNRCKLGLHKVMNKSLVIGTEKVDSKDEGMDTCCEGGKHLVIRAGFSSIKGDWNWYRKQQKPLDNIMSETGGEKREKPESRQGNY